MFVLTVPNRLGCRRVTGRSRIFLELGGCSPRPRDWGPSVELAHCYRTADISARARPQDRLASRVRTVMHPVQKSEARVVTTHLACNGLANRYEQQLRPRMGALSIPFLRRREAGADEEAALPRGRGLAALHQPDPGAGGARSTRE